MDKQKQNPLTLLPICGLTSVYQLKPTSAREPLRLWEIYSTVCNNSLHSTDMTNILQSLGIDESLNSPWVVMQFVVGTRETNVADTHSNCSHRGVVLLFSDLLSCKNKVISILHGLRNRNRLGELFSVADWQFLSECCGVKLHTSIFG